MTNSTFDEVPDASIDQPALGPSLRLFPTAKKALAMPKWGT
ncbi:hypothetical protein [Bosea sp. (in: a-proteobacteria)]|jgi:hypothetical protein